MKYLLGVVLLLIMQLFSCQREGKQALDNEKDKDTINIETADKFISNIGETLQPGAKRAVASWGEYQLIDELLTRYYAISPSEALSNADELNTLSRELKDSIRIKSLEIPEMKARLNVLNSECLRLKDMSEIPAIKQEEVAEKVKDILGAFSAVNAKINSVYAVNTLEKQLDLDPDFQAMIKVDKDSILEQRNNDLKKKTVGRKIQKNTQNLKKHRLNKKLKLDKQLKNKKSAKLKRELSKRKLQKK
jgi:hypothetical protein